MLVLFDTIAPDSCMHARVRDGNARFFYPEKNGAGWRVWPSLGLMRAGLLSGADMPQLMPQAHVRNPADRHGGPVLRAEFQRTDAAVQPEIHPHLPLRGRYSCVRFCSVLPREERHGMDGVAIPGADARRRAVRQHHPRWIT